MRSGRLPGLRFHDHAARAATLIDLVLERRISRNAIGELVASPALTGNAATDKMLTHVEQHPGSSIHDILAKAPVRMAHFLDTADRQHRWYSSRPRISRDEAEVERQRLDRAVGGNIDSPQTAALLMLAEALRLVAQTEPENVLGECGEAAWVVEECVEYLRLLRHKYDMIVAAGSAGSGGS